MFHAISRGKHQGERVMSAIKSVFVGTCGLLLLTGCGGGTKATADHIGTRRHRHTESLTSHHKQ